MSILLACQCDSVVTVICRHVVWAVAVGVSGLLLWRLAGLYAGWKAEERKREWEVADRDRKLEADRETRANMLQDEERRRMTDLTDRKLQILGEACYALSPNEPTKVVKNPDDPAVREYILELEHALTHQKQTTDEQAT